MLIHTPRSAAGRISEWKKREQKGGREKGKKRGGKGRVQGKLGGVGEFVAAGTCRS